jgi:hypothetical protein
MNLNPYEPLCPLCRHPESEHTITGECAIHRRDGGKECGCQGTRPRIRAGSSSTPTGTSNSRRRLKIIVMPREDVRVIRRAMRHWMKKHALPSHQPRRIIHALTHALGECACEEMA